MPFYDFECKKHGVFEVFQRMNDEHVASCPICQNKGSRIFHPSMLSGDLPNKDFRMGKTREELFQNLGKEGMADPDMWKYDADNREKSIYGVED